MEVIQVQPRDTYLHYVYVPTKNTAINWSFTTKRNTIQFGIYKRQGQDPLPSSSEVFFRAPNRQNSLPPGELTSETVGSSAGSIHGSQSTQRTRSKSSATTKLQEQGLDEIIPIQHTNSNITKIEGSYAVTEPGNYVLVFDNTFSRNTPKVLTLSVTLSDGPLHMDGGNNFEPGANPSDQDELTGWLLKKRRKKMQGWAKRWFRLSSKGVLSYSTSINGVPRGLIQIRISTITSQPKSRGIHIDSGTMIYHLKALTTEDHEVWTQALRKHRATGLEAEVGSFEDWRNKRQSRHTSNIAKEKAKIDVTRGLQGSQQLKLTLDALVKHISTNESKATPWMDELIKIKDDLEQAIERQDQQWHVIQETIQNNPGSFASSNGTNTPLKEGEPLNMDCITNGIPLRRTDSLMSHDSNFSEEFYDAEDIELSGDEEESNEQDVVVVEGESSEEEEEEEDDDDDEQVSEQIENKEANEISGDIVPTDWIKLQCSARRQQLPAPACGDVGSALSVFRKNVGKDLSTIAMPVSMNEPLNMLQKACEELEYCELLDKANTLSSSIERLMYITVFAISSYTSSQYRTGRKPFNPLMTETYENIRPDKGFRYISEKVSHNPLIIAAHAESPNYKYWQCTKIKSKFWGKSMEFMTEGVFNVKLNDHDDHYTFNKPSSWMKNMIAGEKYLEHSGEMKVTNHASGEYCTVTFKEGTGGGLFGAPTNKNDIVATFYSKDGKKVRRVVGKWSDKLSEEVDMNKKNLKVLWNANSPGVSNYQDYYGFTKFCMELNEITSIEKDKLPITDTRFRPDQRLYEMGKVDEADAEKQRVEQKQRDKRKELQDNGIEWKPRWFTLQQDPYGEPGFISPEDTEAKSWVYNDQYWQAREKGQWPSDMFELW